jgi:hypothetical protein
MGVILEVDPERVIKKLASTIIFMRTKHYGISMHSREQWLIEVVIPYP